MPEEKFKYDVAISFLARDVVVAQAIYDRLVGGFEVFFFPRNQEELAGTNGLESMRVPFRYQSRLNLVVYRPEWGNTKWTAVEQQAIIDSCLDTAYRSLFLYVIEKGGPLPTWVPENYVYFSSESYTLDEAVGAVKARVQERGGEYKPLTPARKAQMNQVEEDYRRTKSSMSSDRGMAQIYSKVKELFHEICHQCDEVNDGGHERIEYQLHLKETDMEQTCVLGSFRVGMLVSWYKPFGNSLDRSFLGIREFNENTIVPHGYVRMNQPDVISDVKYDPDLSRAFEYGWKPQTGNKACISSKDLASQCVIQFLDLINRDADGKVDRGRRY
jgi:hypothetical protein